MNNTAIEIRNLSLSDLENADQILQAAFIPPETRIPELTRYLTLQPEGWRLADVGGQPVGMVGAIDYGAFAWIGYMAVLPELQNQGIGRALMASILSWLDGRGCPMVRLDASDAGAILYAKIGFVTRGQVLSFAQEERVPIASPAHRVYPLARKNIPAVADFDEPLFGARRESLFEILLDCYPKRAFFSIDEAGQVSGFLFAQAQKIGPWSANTPEDAQGLLARAINLRYEDALRVITPAENKDAANLLARSGFVQKQSHLHMCKGGNSLPGRRELIYGQTSYGVG